MPAHAFVATPRRFFPVWPAADAVSEYPATAQVPSTRFPLKNNRKITNGPIVSVLLRLFPEQNVAQRLYGTRLMTTLIGKFSRPLLAGILAWLTLPGQAAEGQMQMRHPQVTEQQGQTVVSVELENPDDRPRVAEIWAEVYDGDGAYIDRFQSRSVNLKPQQSARAEVVLRELGLGKYRAIIAGRSYPTRGPATFGKAAIHVEHVAPFTLSINRRKEIVLAQQTGTLKPVPTRPGKAGSDRVRTELPRNTPVAGSLAGVPAPSREATPDAPRMRKQARQSQPGGSPPRTYRVRKGDWLSKIARRFYGDAMKYPAIFAANRGIIQNPDLIYPDQVFVIPEENMLTAGVTAPGTMPAAGDIRLASQAVTAGCPGRRDSGEEALLAFLDQDNLGAVSVEIISHIIHERRQDEDAPAAFFQQILRSQRVADSAGIKAGSFIANEYGERAGFEQKADVHPLALILLIPV